MSLKHEDLNDEKARLPFQRAAEHLVSLLPPPRRKRVNLVLSEKHIDRLERLVRLTDSTSIAEVVRDALYVYETLVEKLMLGSSLKELTTKGELFPLELGIDVHRRMLDTVHSPTALNEEISAKDTRKRRSATR